MGGCGYFGTMGTKCLVVVVFVVEGRRDASKPQQLERLEISAHASQSLRRTRRGGQCFRANGRGPALCRVGIRTRYKFDGKPSVAPSPRVGNHPERKLFFSRFGICPEGLKRIIIKETRKLPPSRKAKSCSSTSTRGTHAHMHQPSAQCPMRGVTLSHSIPLYTTDVTTN